MPGNGAPSAAFELGAQRRAVERRGVVGLVRVHRLALDELPLDGEQRRQLVMARLERVHLRRDAEQLREEVLEVRRQRDQQRPLRPCAASASGAGARRVRADRPSAASAARRWSTNSASMRRGAFDRIEVGEREAVSEREHGSVGSDHGRGGRRRRCAKAVHFTRSPGTAPRGAHGHMHRPIGVRLPFAAIHACQRARTGLSCGQPAHAARRVDGVLSRRRSASENRMTVVPPCRSSPPLALAAALRRRSRSRSSSASSTATRSFRRSSSRTRRAWSSRSTEVNAAGGVLGRRSRSCRATTTARRATPCAWPRS